MKVLEIAINGVMYTVESAEAANPGERCMLCAFYEKDMDCPQLRDGGDLCRAMEIDDGPIIFKKMPTFEEDVAELVQSFHCAGTHANTIKQFLSEDRMRALLAIAVRHEVV